MSLFRNFRPSACRALPGLQVTTTWSSPFFFLTRSIQDGAPQLQVGLYRLYPMNTVMISTINRGTQASFLRHPKVIQQGHPVVTVVIAVSPGSGAQSAAHAALLERGSYRAVAWGLGKCAADERLGRAIAFPTVDDGSTGDLNGLIGTLLYI